MDQIGRYIMGAGAGLVLLGAIIWFLGKSGFRGLPGDVFYQSGRVKWYFPIVTCLVISVFLTAIAWLWAWLHKR
jgi:hypothetical protein